MLSDSSHERAIARTCLATAAFVGGEVIGKSLLSFSALFLSIATLAQVSPQETRQPLQELMETEVVYPQDKHEIQFTLSTLFERRGDSSKIASPLSVEYGISDSWQVGMEWGIARTQTPDAEGQHSARGMSDLELSTKYSFMRIRGSHYHAALSLRLALPTGKVAGNLGEGRLEVEPTLIVARDLPRFHDAQIFMQAGLSLPHNIGSTDEPANRQGVWNFGAFVPFKHFLGVLETTTQTDTHKGMAVQVTPGLVVKAPRGFEIGMGFFQPLGPQDRTRHFVFKITHEFGGRKE